MERDEDHTPVVELDDAGRERQRLLRDITAARLDREAMQHELDRARAEIARLGRDVQRLDARNDELLCAEQERDLLRSENDRLTIEILQLKNALRR